MATDVMQNKSDKGKQTILTTCPRDCYDACGIAVVTQQGKITAVTGDPSHPVSRGRLCKKCTTGYNGVWLDPSARLTQPLRRIGPKGEGRFEPVSWDEAIHAITEQLQRLVESAGPETILTTHYTGTFALIGFHFPMRFFNRLGATEVSPDTICNNAGHVALGYVYGTSLVGFDPRTAKDANCIMIWGANPSASAPRTNEHWLQEAPGKVVVIDPIRTPTAQAADLHLQPFPGSDAALAFALMHVLWRDNRLDTDFISAHTVGWEALEAKINDCTPEWGESVTGVPRSQIEEAAQLYGAGPSLLWLGQGLQRQARGGNVMRACAMLPAITGNIGKPGSGFLYLNGLEQRQIDDDYLLGTNLCRNEPRSISHMDLTERLEDRALARALFCWNVNNAASNPEQARLRSALARDDLFTVVVDVFPTDTTDFADYVLPAASFLESDDLIASYFDLTISAQAKVSDPMGESLPNAEIFRRLSAAMGYTEDALYEEDLDVVENVLTQTGVGETFDSLKSRGTVSMSAEPVLQFADLKFPTPSGKVEIASAAAEEDGLPQIPEAYADPRPSDGRLRLLSPASEWLLNDSFGNDPKIEKRLGPATVILHPDDASARGLSEGDPVELANETGRLSLLLQVSDVVPIGVALSHKGRWPKRQPSRANVNVLNPGHKSDMGESSCVHGVEVSISRSTAT